MWLIDTHTLKLKFVTNPEDCRYAILSHTWGNDEVTFEDMKSPAVAEKRLGYWKLRKTCERARSQQLDLAWVDTCCIDKSSSAELSESINSMFEWYRLSTVCYAWLEDWDGLTLESIRDSRWFTRGWTLQELIAPRSVEFLDNHWVLRGDKTKLYFGTIISAITRIDFDILQGQLPLSQVPVGRRMSWAASRQTTRVEDRAYSLLGIFDINMPLLYGEGHKAFLRLQEEIARNSSDLTLFAWETPYNFQEGSQEFFGIFAPALENFKRCSSLVTQSNQFNNLMNFVVTNKGLSILMTFLDCNVNKWRRVRGLSLWCHREEDPGKLLAIPLTRTGLGCVRSHYGILGSIENPLSTSWTKKPPSIIHDSLQLFVSRQSKQALISKVMSPAESRILSGVFASNTSEKYRGYDPRFLFIRVPETWRIHINAKGYPPALWDEEKMGFYLAECAEFIGIVVIDVTLSSRLSSGGELQIVCGYSKEVGGCWAAFALSPLTRLTRAGRMHSSDATVELCLSKFRESDDETRSNSWHGYHALRNVIFSGSMEKDGITATKANMLVDARFDLCDTSTDVKIQYEAHIDCTESNEVEYANGVIRVDVRELKEQRP